MTDETWSDVADDKHRLYELYWGDRQTTIDIAREFDVRIKKVRHAMERLGIPRRDGGPIAGDWRVKIIDEHTDPTENDDVPSKHRLYELYWDEQLTIKGVSNEVDVSRQCVKRLMKEYGIPGRINAEPEYDWRVQWIEDGPPKQKPDLDCDEQDGIAWLFDDGEMHQRHYGPKYPWLRKKSYYYEQYWRLGHSTREIASRYRDWSARKVCKQMRTLGVPRRVAGNLAGDGIPSKYEWPEGKAPTTGTTSQYTREDGSVDWSAAVSGD